MATTIGSIAMNIFARTKPFEAGMKRAQNSIVKLRHSAHQMQGPMGKLSGVIHQLGMFSMGIMLVGSIGKVIATLNAFNRAMAKSTAIMGDLSDAMNTKLRKAAIDTAKVFVHSTTQIAESYFYLASAGLDAKSSLEAMPVVASFAQAGMFDMAKATDLLTDAQTALGWTIRNNVPATIGLMRKLGDTLVKANTVANATVEQFSDALTNKAAAAMRMYGVSIEEGIAVLAAFANQNIKGRDGGTAYTIVMRDLTTKVLTNAEAFKKAKIAVFDEMGAIRNMTDIIGDLERHLSDSSAEQRKQMLLTLGFPQKSIAYIQAIIGMSESIAVMEGELRKANGTMDEVANKTITRLSLAWSRLKAELVDAAGKFTILNDALADTIILTYRTVDGFNALFEPTEKVFASLISYANGTTEEFDKLERELQDVAAGYELMLKQQRNFRVPGMDFIDKGAKGAKALNVGLGTMIGKLGALNSAANKLALSTVFKGLFGGGRTLRDVKREKGIGRIKSSIGKVLMEFNVRSNKLLGSLEFAASQSASQEELAKAGGRRAGLAEAGTAEAFRAINRTNTPIDTLNQTNKKQLRELKEQTGIFRVIGKTIGTAIGTVVSVPE